MLTTNQQKLVTENLNLVYKISHKFTYGNKDDVIQNGMLGLCRAAEAFDRTRGTAFSTFAYYYIYNYCLESVLTDSNFKPQRVGTKNVKVDSVCIDNYINVGYEVDSDSLLDFKNILNNQLFTKLERNILYKLRDGYKKNEIFNMFRLTRSEYSEIFKSIKNKLYIIRQE